MLIAIPVIDRCTKLNLFRALRTVEMTPTAARVLQFLIDDSKAHMWSLRRLAIAVGRSPRSVDAALAELKRLGFVDVIYRRRQTALKVLRVDAILQAVSRAVAIARATARAAISLFRKKLQASQETATNIHPPRLMGAVTADYREQKAPSGALLRSLGLPSGAKRST